jgi:DNA (cytosine-5)-methyltransferase 1
VAGALNSNRGADFGTVLDQMAEAGAVVIEWALLDAQHFGVPQRRRRVFVVAIFDPATASRCPDPLLPVAEGLRGDSAKGKQKGQAVAGTLGGGSGSRGWSPDTDRMTFVPVDENPATSQNIDNSWAAGEHNGILRQSITAKWSKGSSGPSGDEFVNLVVDLPADQVGTLSANDASKWGNNQWVNEGKAIVVPFVKSARAQTATDSETWKPGEVNPTLNQFDMGDTRATTAVVQPIGFSHTQGLSAQPSEQAWPTLRTEGNGMAVRRLTPLECERLMGWPDNWTDGQADSHRYRQCGNGVATPVAHWIAKHLHNLMGDN